MKKMIVNNWDEVPLILNTKEAAELIGCGPQTIRDLCRAKKIPFIPVGRSFKFTREAIRQWLDRMAAENVVNY